MQVILFILAIVLLYFILKPVLIIFLTSIILAYIFYPLYKRIKKLIKYENTSIFITLILIIIIFLMPFVFVASQIPKQTSHIYAFAQDNIIGKGVFDFSCKTSASLKCKAINFVAETEFFDIDKMIDVILSKTIEIVKKIIVSIPSLMVGVGIALFISFFLFKDGPAMLTGLINMIPLNPRSSKRLVDQFGKVTYSVVYAHIIVALVQGALGALGFYLVGIPSPIFWGVVMAIFALLPFVGSALVWAPASILILVNGLISNSFIIMGKGIGLFLFGVFVISTIDNVLRVKIAGGRAGVHPLTVLIGLIGGINLFGLVGIFVGPIALSLLITFFKDFSKTYRKEGG